MNSSMKIIRKLPDAPPYHKAEISPMVAGRDARYMKVMDHAPKLPPMPGESKRKTNIVWTDAKLRKLGEMYDSGVSLDEIGKAFSYTPGAISKYITLARHRGYVKTERQAHRRWTPEEDNTLKWMRQQGKAMDTIAKKLGRSRTSVMNRAKLLRRGVTK